MLYGISHSWYEEYSPILLEGPEVPDWDEYCRSLLPEAISVGLDKDDAYWVGYRTIIDGLAKVLESRGYKIVNPPQFDLWGSDILTPKEGLELVKKLGISKSLVNEMLAVNYAIEESINTTYKYESENRYKALE